MLHSCDLHGLFHGYPYFIAHQVQPTGARCISCEHITLKLFISPFPFVLYIPTLGFHNHSVLEITIFCNRLFLAIWAKLSPSLLTTRLELILRLSESSGAVEEHVGTANAEKWHVSIAMSQGHNDRSN